MNQLQTLFSNKNFGNIRVIKHEDGTIYFVAKDVAECLGYEKQDAMYRRLSDKQKLKINPQRLIKYGFPQIDVLQFEPNTNIKTMILITESGLYKAVLGSILPQAEPFQDWVTDEVLPQIRKSGGYVNDESLFINTYLPHLDEPSKNIFKGLLISLKETNELVEEKENEIVVKENEIVELVDDVLELADEIDDLLYDIVEMTPIIDMFDERMNDNGVMLITDITKLYGLKKGQFMAWAKDNGYVHLTRIEINALGDKYFKKYEMNGLYKIGVRKECLYLIEDNIFDIKNHACSPQRRSINSKYDYRITLSNNNRSVKVSEYKLSKLINENVECKRSRAILALHYIQKMTVEEIVNLICYDIVDNKFKNIVNEYVVDYYNALYDNNNGNNLDLYTHLFKNFNGNFTVQAMEILIKLQVGVIMRNI